jgi:uncharacterized protein YacL
MSLRLGRVVTVTLSIALIGAIIGAVVGGILFAVWDIPRLFGTRGHNLGAANGALFGALLGGVLAPITSWVFLRRVPLGKALLRMTIGTTIGTAIGLTVDALGVFALRNVPSGLIGALAGFLVAAVQLHLTSRTSRPPEGMEAPGPRAPV